MAESKWNYRMIQHRPPGYEPYVAMHEVYYEGDEPTSWTCEPVQVIADEPRDLIRDFAWMMKALSEPVLEIGEDRKLRPTVQPDEGQS